MNYKHAILSLYTVLLFPGSVASASEPLALDLFDTIPCVVTHSQYHNYAAPTGSGYRYGSAKFAGNQPRLHRQDFQVNDQIIRFEGWIAPPGNPSVATLARQREIVAFLGRHGLQLDKIVTDVTHVSSAVSLTEDGNDMMARYRLGFTDEQNCPQPYLTDRVECIGQIIARKFGITEVGACTGLENISTR